MSSMGTASLLADEGSVCASPSNSTMNITSPSGMGPMSVGTLGRSGSLRRMGMSTRVGPGGGGGGGKGGDAPPPSLRSALSGRHVVPTGALERAGALLAGGRGSGEDSKTPRVGDGAEGMLMRGGRGGDGEGTSQSGSGVGGMVGMVGLSGSVRDYAVNSNGIVGTGGMGSAGSGSGAGGGGGGGSVAGGGAGGSTAGGGGKATGAAGGDDSSSQRSNETHTQTRRQLVRLRRVLSERQNALLPALLWLRRAGLLVSVLTVVLAIVLVVVTSVNYTSYANNMEISRTAAALMESALRMGEAVRQMVLGASGLLTLSAADTVTLYYELKEETRQFNEYRAELYAFAQSISDDIYTKVNTVTMVYSVNAVTGALIAATHNVTVNQACMEFAAHAQVVASLPLSNVTVTVPSVQYILQATLSGSSIHGVLFDSVRQWFEESVNSKDAVILMQRAVYIAMSVLLLVLAVGVFLPVLVFVDRAKDEVIRKFTDLPRPVLLRLRAVAEASVKKVTQADEEDDDGGGGANSDEAEGSDNEGGGRRGVADDAGEWEDVGDNESAADWESLFKGGGSASSSRWRRGRSGRDASSRDASGKDGASDGGDSESVGRGGGGGRVASPTTPVVRRGEAGGGDLGAASSPPAMAVVATPSVGSAGFRSGAMSHFSSRGSLTGSTRGIRFKKSMRPLCMLSVRFVSPLVALFIFFTVMYFVALSALVKALALSSISLGSNIRGMLIMDVVSMTRKTVRTAGNGTSDAIEGFATTTLAVVDDLRRVHEFLMFGGTAPYPGLETAGLAGVGDSPLLTSSSNNMVGHLLLDNLCTVLRDTRPEVFTRDSTAVAQYLAASGTNMSVADFTAGINVLYNTPEGRYTACTTLKDGVLTHGLHGALAAYYEITTYLVGRRLAANVGPDFRGTITVTQADGSTLVQPYSVATEMTRSDMEALRLAGFLFGPQASFAVGDVYATAGLDTVNGFILFESVFATVFLSAFVCFVAFYYLPAIDAENRDIRKQRTLLLLLPPQIFRMSRDMRHLLGEFISASDAGTRKSGGRGHGR